MVEEWTAPTSSWRSSAAQGLDALIAIGGDGSLQIAHALHQQGPARGRGAQDDRQRPGPDRGHLRLRHRRAFRHRVHRPPALDGRVAPAHHGGRGHGPLRRLDRPARRRGRVGRRHPHPRDPLRHRTRWPTRSRERERGGRHFSIVVVAEGAAPKDGGRTVAGGENRREGGAAGRRRPEGRRRAREADRQGDARRGARAPAARRHGPPRSDRLISLRFGAAAVRALERGPLRRHGGAGPADGQLRAAGSEHPAHEDGAAGLRHHAHRAGPRHRLRRLILISPS
ncbi:MAG: hypothetical protein M0C28_37530 [Candidatus Moduliflexus flocculans]|nr:hypothetical protein [Candidatus Moduliflexus flocculans]